MTSIDNQIYEAIRCDLVRAHSTLRHAATTINDRPTSGQVEMLYDWLQNAKRRYAAYKGGARYFTRSNVGSEDWSLIEQCDHFMKILNALYGPQPVNPPAPEVQPIQGLAADGSPYKGA